MTGGDALALVAAGLAALGAALALRPSQRRLRSLDRIVPGQAASTARSRSSPRGVAWPGGSAARRRTSAVAAELPQALDLLAACLSAGMPLRRATVIVADSLDGPLQDDLRGVVSLIDLGAGDSEAWGAVRSHAQLGGAASDLARSVESGTKMVEALRHHAEAAREARRTDLHVAARAVGVRSVLPLMLCFIPSFVLVGVVPTVASAVLHALG